MNGWKKPIWVRSAAVTKAIWIRQISSIGIIGSHRAAMESSRSEEGDDDDANPVEDRQQ
ncbi:hypothetical protein ACLOJK_000202 [Asimina triloba]